MVCMDLCDAWVDGWDKDGGIWGRRGQLHVNIIIERVCLISTASVQGYGRKTKEVQNISLA